MSQILIIDDDPVFLIVLESHLIQAGHDTVAATSALLALAKMDGDYVPDLVMTDLFMEGMDGFEFIKQMKRRHPQIPVIALSSHTKARGSFLEMACQLGARCSLEKPLDWSLMEATINQAMTAGSV